MCGRTGSKIRTLGWARRKGARPRKRQMSCIGRIENASKGIVMMVDITVIVRRGAVYGDLCVRCGRRGRRKSCRSELGVGP